MCSTCPHLSIDPNQHVEVEVEYNGIRLEKGLANHCHENCDKLCVGSLLNIKKRNKGLPMSADIIKFKYKLNVKGGTPEEHAEALRKKNDQMMIQLGVVAQPG